MITTLVCVLVSAAITPRFVRVSTTITPRFVRQLKMASTSYMQSLHTGCYTVAGFSLASSSPQTQALSFEKWRELGTVRLPPVLSKKSTLNEGLVCRCIVGGLLHAKQ